MRWVDCGRGHVLGLVLWMVLSLGVFGRGVRTYGGVCDLGSGLVQCICGLLARGRIMALRDRAIAMIASREMRMGWLLGGGV